MASERWQVRRNQERSKRRGPNESEDSQESRTAVDSVGGIGGCENLTSDHGRRIKGLKATADGQHSDLSPLMAPKRPPVEIRRTVTILTHRVQAMLEAVDLSKRYGPTVALERLNLAIEPGDVFCLLGANGAGKTTTINLFLNFIDPSGGTARINGLDVTKAPLETKNTSPTFPIR